MKKPVKAHRGLLSRARYPSLFKSLDWTSTGYGISNPKLSVTDNKDMCDQGKGMLTVFARCKCVVSVLYIQG